MISNRTPYDRAIQRARGWTNSGEHGDFGAELQIFLSENLGLEVLGYGAFGATVDAEDVVIKFFDACDHAYLSFVDFCEKVESPYLPKIFWDMRLSKTLHVVVMEKLDSVDIFGDHHMHRQMERCRAKAGRYRFAKYALLPRNLLAVLDLMEEHLRDENRRIDEENARGGTCYWHGGWDLHDGNFMRRDNQLVITDPWCC
jgi:hypothetical protein